MNKVHIIVTKRIGMTFSIDKTVPFKPYLKTYFHISFFDVPGFRYGWVNCIYKEACENENTDRIH
jgi:hypothetical protein